MDSVKVDRVKLLETIRENREKHRTVFLEAIEGYKEAVIEALEKRLTDAKKNKRVSHIIQLVQPMDQTKEYDKIIRMLEMSIEQNIELSDREFAQYVMDDWTWKHQFLVSNSGYSKSASDTLAMIE